MSPLERLLSLAGLLAAAIVADALDCFRSYGHCHNALWCYKETKTAGVATAIVRGCDERCRMEFATPGCLDHLHEGHQYRTCCCNDKDFCNSARSAQQPPSFVAILVLPAIIIICTHVHQLRYIYDLYVNLSRRLAYIQWLS
uniref:Uncharacterized protein n=1 Tax=Plectus sambesii TaxID=2011161 RepID=A0A914WS53_9BILA